MAKKVITISREFGSGGHDIGEEAAKRLGYYFLDEELSAKIAEKTGFSKAFIEEKGEYAPSKSLFSYGLLGRDQNGMSLEDMVYSVQTKIINETAERGDCVIIGRNADYVLRGRNDVLNIFICGDKEAKKERTMKLFNISEKEALKRMDLTDRKRATNYKYYTDQTWGMAGNYSFCINSSELGFERTVQMIVALAQQL